MKTELVEEMLEWKNVVVIDFENYQCIPSDLLNKDYIYYLFCGVNTVTNANKYKAMLDGYDVNVIESKHTGTNFVDNRISMYIGYIFGKYSPRQIVVVSNDIDYYEMIFDLKNHGYPIVLREPSLGSKDVIKRQQEYILYVEKIKESDDAIVKNIIEFNDGECVVGLSKLRYILRKNLNLSKAEIQSTIDMLTRGHAKPIKKKGKEMFYQLL